MIYMQIEGVTDNSSRSMFITLKYLFPTTSGRLRDVAKKGCWLNIEDSCELLGVFFMCFILLVDTLMQFFFLGLTWTEDDLLLSENFAMNIYV